MNKSDGSGGAVGYLAPSAAGEATAEIRGPLSGTQGPIEETIQVGAGEPTVASVVASPSTETLGRLREYQLLEKLGEGGMGAVYKALHTRLDKIVALKVLPADKTRNADAMARFEREMKAVGRLAHQNIVGAHDAGEVDGTHFLVMELVDGVDLSALVARLGPLDVADACELVRQAAVGLQEAHEHGMVHRDIKPSNLMLTVTRRKQAAAGVVKILDMGLALLDDRKADGRELTGTGQLMGTIDYMAPEQATDTHRVDIRADVYSLGITLYKLLTGGVPLNDPRHDTVVKKLLALVNEQPASIATRRPDLPPALVSLIDRMLSKRPDDRPATPDEVATALEPFTAGHRIATLLDAQPGVPRPAAEWTPTTSVATDAARSRTHQGLGATAVMTQPRSGDRSYGRRPLLIAAGIGGLVLLAALTIVFLQTPHGVVRIEYDDPQIEVRIKGPEAEIRGADKETVQLRTGEHTLVVKRGDFTFETNKLIINKGDKSVLRVEFLPGKVQVLKDGRTLDERSLPAPVVGETKPSPPAVAAITPPPPVKPASVPASLPTPAPSEPPSPNAPPPANAPFDAARARQLQADWAAFLGSSVEPQFRNSIGMNLRLIPPGELHLNVEGQSRRVYVERPYFLGVHEVTQAQYQQVMGQNPSECRAGGRLAERVEGQDTSRHPVESVSWLDAVEFCNRLSEREQRTKCYLRDGESVQVVAGNGYRLPLETEWEHACRAGSVGRFCFGDEDARMGEYGWHSKNGDGTTHPVGQKLPNAFDLFDMHGHVKEWCGFAPGRMVDATTRLSRLGGGIFNSPAYCLNHTLEFGTLDKVGADTGFRVVLGVSLPGASIAPPKPLNVRSTVEATGPVLKPSQTWTDLLSQIDPVKDTISGDWFEPPIGVLRPQQDSRLRLPVRVQGGYDLKIDLTVQGAPRIFTLTLPIPGGRTNLTLQFYSANGAYRGGIELPARSLLLDDKHPAVAKVDPFTANERKTLLVHMETDDDQVLLRTTVNDQPFASWSGAASDLMQRPPPKASEPIAEPSLMLRRGAVQLHAVDFRVLSGEARFLRELKKP